MLDHGDGDSRSVVTRVLEGILFGALVCGIHCVGSVVFGIGFVVTDGVDRLGWMELTCTESVA